MGLFSFGKKRERRFLIVDIESGSVGAAELVCMPGAKPLVSFTARERITPTERLEPSRFFMATLAALKTLTMHLVRFYGNELARAEELHLFLHAPWIVSKTRSVHKEFAKPTILTERAVAEIVQAAERGIEENFAAAHREIAGAVRVVEKKITEFSVNGYTVTHPYGNEARTLELTLLESFSPENAVLRFGTILQAFTSVLPEWHGAASACAGALAETGTDAAEDARMVLMAGSEATECAMIRAGVVREIASVPFGMRTAARTACETGTFHSVAAAEAYLSTHARVGAVFAPVRRQRVEAARVATIERYRHALSTLIFPKLTAGFFPHEASLLAAEEHVSFFEDMLRRPLRGNMSHTPSLDISVRGAPAFASLLQWVRVAPPDTFLAAEMAFVSRYKNL